jgi:hypothetical protein
MALHGLSLKQLACHPQHARSGPHKNAKLQAIDVNVAVHNWRRAGAAGASV